MRSAVFSGLTMMGLAAALLPASVWAQAPAGYVSTPATAQVVGPDGKPVISAAPVPVAAVKPAPHSHKGLLRGRTVCANCAKKEQAAMLAQGPMTEQIVACAHSKNGACASCRALLAMPGAVVVGGPGAAPSGPAEAPGRAVVSNTPDGPAGHGAVAAVYDPSATPEPAPIGVMQTNYAQAPGAMPAAPTSIPTAASMQPGHALVEGMGASPAPFQHKPTSSRNPRILSHLLFGTASIGAEFREQRAQRKNEAHASIPYNNEGTTINEVPASVIYGRR